MKHEQGHDELPRNSAGQCDGRTANSPGSCKSTYMPTQRAANLGKGVRPKGHKMATSHRSRKTKSCRRKTQARRQHDDGSSVTEPEDDANEGRPAGAPSSTKPARLQSARSHDAPVAAKAGNRAQKRFCGEKAAKRPKRGRCADPPCNVGILGTKRARITRAAPDQPTLRVGQDANPHAPQPRLEGRGWHERWPPPERHRQASPAGADRAPAMYS